MTQTKTQTVIRTRVEFDRALRQANLDVQQEQVLRMRYGIAAADDTTLEFRSSGRCDVDAQLAALEERALQELAARAGAGPVDAGRRANIIDRLRRI